MTYDTMTQEQLDEAVHEAKADEAAAINNGGRAEQIAYLAHANTVLHVPSMNPPIPSTQALAGRVEDLTRALRSLLADIEGMQNDRGPCWYGRFSEYAIDDDMLGRTASVEWPNLNILAVEARKVLGDNTDGDQLYRLDDREHATVLAALRYWQATREGRPCTVADLMEVATNSKAFPSLTRHEIDALCERLNTGG